MCVIAVVEYIRPTDEQVEQMWEANSHGGGVAWREEDPETGEMVVQWEKGLSKEEMINRNHALPLPYVLHFRVPSANTSTSVLACHPFQIDESAATGFAGKISGYVLFHNGFWAGWTDKLQRIAENKRDARLPSGPWSDSRGLAFAAYHLGFGYIELTGEKIVAFGPGEDDIDVFGAWQKVLLKDCDGKEKHFLVSNRGWEKSTTTANHHNHGHTQKLLDSAQKTVTGQAGGTVHQGTFRSTDDGAGKAEKSGNERRGDQQERVQAETSNPSTAEAGALTLCSGCAKFTRAGTIQDGKWFCWQCWADVRRPEKRWVGTCHLCKTAQAGALTQDTDKWICMSCWETNNKPKVYFRHEEERIKALRERQARGERVLAERQEGGMI